MRGLLRRDIKRAAKQLGVDLGAVLGKSGGEYEESLKALELGDLSVYPPAEQLKRARDHFVDVVAEVETGVLVVPKWMRPKIRSWRRAERITQAVRAT